MSEQAVRTAIETCMREARRAIDEYGVSERALESIQRVLAGLGAIPELRETAGLQHLHQGGAAATVLASEGEDGLTLVYARFPPDAPTPIHDHGSWGVAYVVAGQDRYIHWRRVDDLTNLDRAELVVEYDRILRAGDSVYWFGPPGDIHSQQGHDGETVWELVMFGHNAVVADRHYFDRETGQIVTAKSQ